MRIILCAYILAFTTSVYAGEFVSYPVFTYSEYLIEKVHLFDDIEKRKEMFEPEKTTMYIELYEEDIVDIPYANFSASTVGTPDGLASAMAKGIC